MMYLWFILLNWYVKSYIHSLTQLLRLMSTAFFRGEVALPVWLSNNACIVGSHPANSFPKNDITVHKKIEEFKFNWVQAFRAIVQFSLVAGLQQIIILHRPHYYHHQGNCSQTAITKRL